MYMIKSETAETQLLTSTNYINRLRKMMSLSVEQLCGLSISPPARVFANNSATSPQRQHTPQPLGREATTAIPSSQTSNAKGKKEKEGY